MNSKPLTELCWFRGVGWTAVFFTAYLGLAIVTTWPLADQLSTHLPGQSDDTLLHYWNGWWVQQALQQGVSPYFTPLLFYPAGVSLVTQNMAWFQIAPWLLLEPVTGGTVAYNLALLLNLTLCGCACFLLVWRLTVDPRAAFLSGLIYQAWPYRISQLDHPNLIATAWIPLFLLALILTLEKGQWRYVWGTGLCYAFIGYTRWQLLIPATLMGMIYVLVTARTWLFEKWRLTIIHLAVAACIAIVLLLPPFWLLVTQQSQDDSADLLREGEETLMQTDVLAFFTPSNAHTFFHEQTDLLYERYYGDRPSHRRVPAYLGAVALLLASIGFWRQGRKGLPWFLMALLLMGLALGPLLRVNGRFYPEIPTLYNLIPGVNLMRVPDRFNMFLALPVAVLAGYGLAGWQTGSQRRMNWVMAMIGLLILGEYTAVPVLTNPFTLSPYWQQLADEPGEFAILNLPIDVIQAKLYMYEQTVHKRPILQGNLSRLPNDAYDFLDSNAWLNSLHYAQEIDPQLNDVGQQLATLAKDGIGYIVIHKTRVGADRVAHWQRYLLMRPRYEDEQVVVYATQPELKQDFALMAEFAPGFGPIRILVSADCANPGRVVEVDVGWGQAQANQQDETVVLSLVDGNGRTAQTATFPLTTASTIAWGYYPLRLAETLLPGEYSLLMGIEGGERPLLLQTLSIQPKLCTFAVAPEATTANALFGDELQLLAYEIKRNENQVVFILHWRSQQRMNTDYKVFVHVFDPETGIPVAQDDSKPRREAYPTIYWGPGEILADRVPISLRSVPPGAYGVAIGVYDPVTGERLLVVRGDGVVVEDDRYILHDVIEIK